MNLTEFSKEVHKDNVEKGFYEDFNELKKYVIDTTYERNQTLKTMFVDQRLALIMSEAGEAVEANRKDKLASLERYNKALKEGFSNEESFKTYVKDTFEDEIADVMIRCLNLCGFMEIDIQRHIELKLA